MSPPPARSTGAEGNTRRDGAALGEGTATATLHLILDAVIASVAAATGACVVLRSGDGVTVAAATGGLRALADHREPAATSLFGAALRQHTVIRCDDPASDSRFDTVRCAAMGIGSMVAVPVLDGSRVRGVLAVVAGQHAAFNDADARQIELLAGVAGPALRQSDAVTSSSTGRDDAQDLAEQRQNRAKHGQMAQLLEIAPVAVVVHDAAQRITVWNRGAEETYGWTPEQASGRNLYRLLQLEPVDGSPISDIGTALQDTGRWMGQLRAMRADGAEVLVSSRQLMQRDIDQESIGVLTISTDITAQLRAERSLADREQHFRTQFERAALAQCVSRLDGVVIDVNEAFCRLLGVHRTDLLVANLHDLTHPDERRVDMMHLADLYDSDTSTYQRESRLVRPDGTVVNVDAHVTLVRDADGRPRSVMSQLQDITAQIRAEQERDEAALELFDRNQQLEQSNTELQQANQLKLDLMGMLSHEIGSPLTGILGHAEVIAEAGALSERQRRSLDAILRNANRIATMRTEILTMFALNAGNLTAQREPVNVATAVSQALAAVDHPLPTDQIPTELAVAISPSHLQHILINYLTNAAKYGDGASSIDVVAAERHVDLKVCDRGPGVPPAFREHLFDRFTRSLDASQHGQGSGLGFYIVRGLAEANGAMVWYEPNAPTGSAFCVRLDRVIDEAPETRDAEHTVPAAPA